MVRIRPVSVLRHGAMDLLMAAGFLAVWLMRERFEYDTLRSLLLWPVVFEFYLAVALFLASWVAGVASSAVRWLWIIGVCATYLFLAWLTAATGQMPTAASIALWLLLARAGPPVGMSPGSRLHLRWLRQTSGFTVLLWGGAGVAMLILMLLIPGPTTQAADGTLRSEPPAWIFPLVWTPYFVAEALLRTHRVLAAGVGRTASAC